MDALKAIITRRSIRKYKNKKIPESIIKKLINAGMSAPSCYNYQPWIFILIKKIETKKAIIKAKGGCEFITKAPLVIACCYNESLTKDKHHNIENVTLAVENILITANALGLGACYMGAFDPENPSVEKKLSKALKLPKQIHLVSLISIGYPDEIPKKKTLRPINQVLKREIYK